MKTFIPMTELKEALNNLICRHLLVILVAVLQVHSSGRWYRSIGSLMPKKSIRNDSIGSFMMALRKWLHLRLMIRKLWTVLQKINRQVKGVDSFRIKVKIILHLFRIIKYTYRWSGCPEQEERWIDYGFRTVFIYIEIRVEPKLPSKWDSKKRQTPGFTDK